MEFHNKLYQLRKQKGLSQEEMAGRLNVSRQTVSKWEIGDSTPDMEKLVAISDLFEISLDELVMDKKIEKMPDNTSIKNTFLTVENKEKGKKALKIIGIGFTVFAVVDIISFIVYVSLYGFPK